MFDELGQEVNENWIYASRDCGEAPTRENGRTDAVLNLRALKVYGGSLVVYTS